MGNHMGRLAAMAKGERPFDAEQAQRSAELVKTFSALPWEGFLPGSSGGKSKVKGDPWASADDFKSLQQGMRTEAAKLPAAAGSLDTLRAQVGATGKACKACHDKYREK
jgi:cytochrome c556